MRLNQFLARAGLGSRRSVEALITAGRVRIGDRQGGLGDRVDPAQDSVSVDGKPVTLPAQFTYLLLHKPPGYTVTRRDPRAQKTVYELLPAQWRRLAYVGRLDTDSEGLLLFTDDGVLAHRLLRPETGVEREYLVTSREPITAAVGERLQAGVTLDDGHESRPVRVVVESPGKSGGQLRIVLREGKKREVRRLCQHVGVEVTRLVRLRFGPICLGRLPAGKLRELTAREVKELQASQENGPRDKKLLP